MIDKNNIKAFINFLYLYKHGAPASEELLAKWNNLTEEQVQAQLKHLFVNWNYTPTSVINLKNEFIAKQKKANDSSTQAAGQNSDTPNTPVTEPTVAVTANTNNGKKNIFANTIFKILGLIVLLGLIYLGYEFLKYNNLKYVYAISENIIIRNASGQKLDSLSFTPTKTTNVNVADKIKVLDDLIYERTIDERGGLKPHRKILYKTEGFIPYLLNKEKYYAYINANYVVDDEEEVKKYKQLFRALNKEEMNKYELRFRKVILFSSQLYKPLADAYVLPTCAAPAKRIKEKYSLGICQNLERANNFMVLCPMSDGYYYCFAGDVKAQTYQKPIKLTIGDGTTNYLPNNTIFKLYPEEKCYYAFDCNGNALNLKSVHNTDGIIMYFENTIEKDSFFDEMADEFGQTKDAIKNTVDAVRDIFQ
jgi:hypothetical protein